MMRIGIDASRCKSGGGISHIKGILTSLDPHDSGFEVIHLWVHPKLRELIPEREWLVKHTPKALSKNIFFQLYWQAFCLRKELILNKCDILFTLDGSSLCNYTPNISMSRDMLSYEKGIMGLYGYTIARIRLILILFLQNRTFKKSTGVIFLTNYAAQVIQKKTGLLCNATVIPHGVSDEFKSIIPNLSRDLTNGDEIHCLYVSNTALYKNQWSVVKGVELLRGLGHNIPPTLVGGGDGKAQKLLERQIKRSGSVGNFVTQYGFVDQSSLPIFLSKADIFIFASSCENMPNTLVEAMSAGLPIACSNRGPMPEILKDAGLYFDPESPETIAIAIETLINNSDLRIKLANQAREYSRNYSWQRTATETFTFISKTFNDYKKGL